jgi:NAD(P)H dehydrogenase (quinone)
MGRRVLELLLDAGATSLIATTRTPEKLAAFSACGVDVRPASFDDPASLDKAFAGADRLLLISTDTVGQPGQRIKQHVNAVEAAEKAGVSHILYTSLLNPGPESPVRLAPDHHATEQAITASKMGYTWLRNAVYADSQIRGLAQAVQSGKLFKAAGDGKIAYVTREDCARAAAAALNASFSGRRALDITGPQALTQAEIAAIVTRITGRAVEYVPIPLETLIENMVKAGLPQPVAELIGSFDAAIAQGTFEVASSAFEALTGHKPTHFADFLAANRDALLPAPAGV